MNKDKILEEIDNFLKEHNIVGKIVDVNISIVDGNAYRRKTHTLNIEEVITG